MNNIMQKFTFSLPSRSHPGHVTQGAFRPVICIILGLLMGFVSLVIAFNNPINYVGAWNLFISLEFSEFLVLAGSMNLLRRRREPAGLRRY